MDNFFKSLEIREEINDKIGMGFVLYGIGYIYMQQGKFSKAKEYLEKSLSVEKEAGYREITFGVTTFLYLTYKHLGTDYDKKEIHSLIKKAENIEFELNYALYELLEDTSYLETAYNQVQEKASAMDDGAKFLSYPIPKAIVEEWKKVK